MRATVPHFLRIAFLRRRKFLGSFCGSGSVNLIAPLRWVTADEAYGQVKHTRVWLEGPYRQRSGWNTRMLSEPEGFGRDICVDLRWCSVAVLEDVVLVLESSEPFGRRQLVSEALVDPEGQLSWGQLAGHHPGGKCSCGGFLAANAAGRIEGEAQFVECWGKEFGDVVIRLRACASDQDPQGGTVEAGNECITGSVDDVNGTALADAPEDGMVLKRAGC